MPRKRTTPQERAAAVALFSNLNAKRRRIALGLLWEFTPRSEWSAPVLRAAHPFADKDIKAEIRAATKAGA